MYVKILYTKQETSILNRNNFRLLATAATIVAQFEQQSFQFYRGGHWDAVSGALQLVINRYLTVRVHMAPHAMYVFVFILSNNEGEGGKKAEMTAGPLKWDYVAPNSEGVTFLGLLLHAALKWKQWVAETARKTAGATGILGWLRHTCWRADPLLLLRLYKSLVRARIEYGSFLIHGLSNSKKVLI
jgi:hypothetical protein